ncbi:MAG: glycosyltransferase family 4 protein [Pirellulaceae bacterium]|nr:glycosyltransferase family 4 protein [Pirellulaceae bacterium]
MTNPLQNTHQKITPASGQNIGFVSTRFAGTDGVSLESTKWGDLLTQMGHSCFWMAGQLDRHGEDSILEAAAYFGHAEVQWIHQQVFGTKRRTPEVTKRIYDITDRIKSSLYKFQSKFSLDLILVENAWAIPMNIPLGLALTQFIAETGMPAIGHHHDFYWERTRFDIHAIGDILDSAFPPSLKSIRHATINTQAQQNLGWRKGLSSILVPNVLDFETPPNGPDTHAHSFRESCGFADDDLLFLQPTRVVPRKGIEHAITLLSLLGKPNAKLIVSHPSGDEGDTYLQDLITLANRSNVELHFLGHRISESRTPTTSGETTFTLADVYSQTDFVTYPSYYEGFGNALLEAFYYKKPILVNRYPIFIQDIEPIGFQVVTMDNILTPQVVQKVRNLLASKEQQAEVTEKNYLLAKKHFGYPLLSRRLSALLHQF